MKKASERLPSFLTTFNEYLDSIFNKSFKASYDALVEADWKRSNIFVESDNTRAIDYGNFYGLDTLPQDPYKALVAQIISEKKFGTVYSYTSTFFLLNYYASLFLVDSLSNQINLPNINVTTVEEYNDLLKTMYSRWDNFDWSNFFGGTEYYWDKGSRYNSRGVYDVSRINYILGRRFVAVALDTPVDVINYFSENLRNRNNPIGSKCEWGYFYHASMVPYFNVPNYKIKDESTPLSPLKDFSIVEVVRSGYRVTLEPFSKYPLSYLITDEILDQYIGTYKGGVTVLKYKTPPSGYNFKLTLPNNNVINISPLDIKRAGENFFVKFEEDGTIVLYVGLVDDSFKVLGNVSVNDPLEAIDIDITYAITYKKRNYVTVVYNDTIYSSEPAIPRDGVDGLEYVYSIPSLGTDIIYKTLTNEISTTNKDIEKLIVYYTTSVGSDLLGDFLLSWEDNTPVEAINLLNTKGTILGTFEEFNIKKNQKLLLFSDGVAPPRGVSRTIVGDEFSRLLLSQFLM